MIVVTGVSGSGKDFLLEKVRPLINSKVSFLNFGQALFEEVRRNQPGISSRDQLASLDYRTFHRERLVVVSKALQTQPVVLNTHMLLCFSDGLVFADVIDRLLLPRTYVHISSPVSEIYERRKQGNRERRVETESRIRLHQNLSLYTTAVVAKDLGSEFIRICNKEDNVETSIQILSKAINALA